MNNYTYEQLEVGMEAEFEVVITSEMQRMFGEMSGDRNPLHTDAEFARKAGYRDCVCYGFLVASLYSRLAGMYLPGERSLLQCADVEFVNSVFVGDRLVVTGAIVEMHAVFRRVTVKARIVNQLGRRVGRARLQVGVL